LTAETPHPCHRGGDQPPTHFIGIGGAGMSAIALVLAAAGCDVQGSDRTEGPYTRALRDAGIPVFIGHEVANIGDMERVVYTRAVPQDNPELVAARERGLPVLERAEMLGELYELFDRRVSVTGTHGKTTTSGLLASILVRCGADPTVLVGGDVLDLHGGARLGRSSTIVAEACEAYGSFLHLRSSLAVVTNVDADHLDYYHTFDGVKQGFVQFMNAMDQDGVVVACADDPTLMSLRPSVARKWITYGFADGATYQVTSLSSGPSGQTMQVCGPDLEETFPVPLYGRHFALNALGAIVAAVQLGCANMEAIRGALKSFRGVERRMQVKGHAGGVTVVDDYGHHPTEVRATLLAAREQFSGPLTVVFQPHLYSRTAEHLQEFAEALYPAETLVITNVFPARETPDQGVQADALYDTLRRLGHTGVHYVPELHDVAPWLAGHVQPGAVVLTVGAGDVYLAGEGLLGWLRAHTRHAQ